MARNKYARACYQCGEIVEIGTGHFERHNGAWRTKHANVPGDGRVTCEMARAIISAKVTPSPAGRAALSRLEREGGA